MVKRIGGHWCAITRVGWKMSTTGIEVEGVNTTLLVSQNCRRWGLVLRRCARDSPACLSINVGEEEERQIVCVPQMCVLDQGYGGSSRSPVADNYKDQKKENPWLGVIWMICSLGELGISDSVVPKEFCRWHQILAWRCRSRWGSLLLPRLDDEIIELSITPNRADAPSMRGVRTK